MNSDHSSSSSRSPLPVASTARVIRTFEEIKMPIETEEVYPELECSICSHILGAPQTLVPCGHSFCGPCAWKWIESFSNPTCPHCRVKVATHRSIVPNIIVDQIIERKLQSLIDGVEKDTMLLDREEKLREWKEIQRKAKSAQRQSHPQPGSPRGLDDIVSNLINTSSHNRRASRNFAALGDPIRLVMSTASIETTEEIQ
ncbi:hypothetical protein L204_102932 [Cryptococcus depauperatus]|nr:hypothetical protein L204_00318 [Cryptococcus depauperatus CBS 7855]